MSTPETDDFRQQQRLEWTHAVLADRQVTLERASTDAGFRSYWRVLGSTSAYIVMDSPPEKEDPRPWKHIHDLLDGAGVRVPKVWAHALDAGFLLLEDLGRANVAQVITDDTADRYMRGAIGQLIQLQQMHLPANFPTFGEALLQRDAGLFEQWFVREHLGIELECADSERLEYSQRLLMNNALTQVRVPTHRDFMLRNLMPAEDGLAVLDFQDMVLGPIAYDPISLMRDAFISWPENRVQQWLTHYHTQACAAGLPIPELATFLHDADWLGIQRHLKILGIFARLHYRDKKPHYLADAPRFFTYLDTVLPKYNTLAPLAELFERTIKPAFAKVRA